MAAQTMTPQTVYITRWVAGHEGTEGWYTQLFGRPADCRPVPNCLEWRLGEQVLFQLIEAPERRGETSVAFHVADLDAETSRLAGVEVPAPALVEGFTALRYAGLTDPEGAPVGLLDGA